MWQALIIMVIGSFAIACIGTRVVLHLLRKKQILDKPNTRSNHKLPTPRGGGIAVVGTILLGLTGACIHHQLFAELYPILLCTCVLALISWRDDIKPLSSKWRLLAQISCVAFALHTLFPGLLLFQGFLPVAVDKLAAALLWIWFINLYNFMDGIDGITGAETLAICMGIIALVPMTTLPNALAFHAALIGSATLGFLCWNWHPAKLFLGDVGSVPLGFLLGWLLLAIAYQGYWLPALILPAYYLADSGITLLRRLSKGEKIWEAHSQHFYQRAVRTGKSHSHVVLTITFANAALVVLAILSTTSYASPLPLLGMAAGTVGTLLFTLNRKTVTS